MTADVSIRESEIEDILVMFPDIAAAVLGLKGNLSVICRQKQLPSGGRLDVAFLAGAEIVLIELKVEPFRSQFISQIVQYQTELASLQSAKEFPEGQIRGFLLTTGCSAGDRTACASSAITLINYSVAEVFERYMQRLQSAASFMSVRPTDYGIWSLHLLNPLLVEIGKGTSAADLPVRLRRSKKTVANQVRFASDLLLASTVNGNINLTDLGKDYVSRIDVTLGLDVVSDSQARLLRNFIVQWPYRSPLIFGIYNVVDAVFSLTRNTYPVPLTLLLPFYRESVGKHFEWKTSKAAIHGTRMYSNYAISLGLLGRVGNAFYLTPSGVQFVLMLQLHKSIGVVDALRAWK